MPRFREMSCWKFGNNAVDSTWESFSARELQHAGFSWESHLCDPLDHPRKSNLTSFGEGLLSRIGAYQVATIRRQNAKKHPMSNAQVDCFRNKQF